MLAHEHEERQTSATVNYLHAFQQQKSVDAAFTHVCKAWTRPSSARLACPTLSWWCTPAAMLHRQPLTGSRSPYHTSRPFTTSPAPARCVSQARWRSTANASSVAEQATAGGDVRLTGADRSHETDVVVIGSGECCRTSTWSWTAVLLLCGTDCPPSCCSSHMLPGAATHLVAYLWRDPCRHWRAQLCSTACQVWSQGQ